MLLIDKKNGDFMKIILNFAAFGTAFLFALLLTSAGSLSLTRSSKKEKSFQARAKVYNFLLADKVRSNESSSKSLALKLQPKPNPEPNSMDELVEIRKRLNFELYEARLKADTSELPEDFKEAWSKYLTSQKLLLSLFYSGEHRKKEAAEAISKEIQSLEQEYKNVVKSYGFELKHNLLGDEES
jgi:hypothetical protein